MFIAPPPKKKRKKEKRKKKKKKEKKRIFLTNLFNLLCVTRLTLTGFDPADFRRSPDLPPADFGTVAEKRVSSSDTSNSGALRLEGNYISEL